MKGKVNGSEERYSHFDERSSQFENRAKGSTGEEAPLLRFGDHTRTIREKEISNDETYNQEGHKSVDHIDYLTSKINFLQQQLKMFPVPQHSGKEDFPIEMKLLKVARQRLKFDSDDVYSSIRSWDYFFNIYEITSDRDQFYAIEQLLPAHIQRALSVYNEVKASYVWLVSFLKERYDPKFMCHEMNKYADESTSVTELEDLATEAAKCPQEHLVKHFMLETCTEYHRQKMQPFLLLPMKDFKFQLKLLLKGYSNKQLPTAAQQSYSVDSKEKSETHLKIQSIYNQHIPSKSITPKTKAKQETGKEQKFVKHVGTFSCDGCTRRWVSHSLFCAVGESDPQVTRQCFNCLRKVSAQNIKVLHKDCWVGQCEESPPFLKSSVSQHRRVCYGCGLSGHIVSDCKSKLNVEMDKENSLRDRRNFGSWHTRRGVLNMNLGRYEQRGV